jgi:hypothetical protein
VQSAPDGTDPEESCLGLDEDLEREQRARERLLEWEAADLTQVVAGEMQTERRQFALFLYQTVAKAQTLGMSDERFLYHVRYALEQYRSQV